MTVLILGLVLFLATHSIRIVAEDWRARQVARFGEHTWKGLYALVALAGFALMVWGYGLARAGSPMIWSPPLWMRHVTSLLMPVSFVLLAAAYVPGNRIKAAMGHPMVVGVKVWALAHLLSNGRAADVILFGAFLVWAVLDFRAARVRDRASGTRYPAGTLRGDLITVSIGLIATAVFVLFLHAWLIGVPLLS